MVQCDYWVHIVPGWEQCMTEATHTITPDELEVHHFSYAIGYRFPSDKPVNVCTFHYRYWKEGYTRARKDYPTC